MLLLLFTTREFFTSTSPYVLFAAAQKAHNHNQNVSEKQNKTKRPVVDCQELQQLFCKQVT